MSTPTSEIMSTTSPSEVLSMAELHFSKFGSLPIEVRRMIWHAAALPRIVHFEMVAECDGEQPAQEDSIRSRSVPVLFSICKESRSAAEEIYTKAFESALQFTWFNFDLDIFYPEWNIELRAAHNYPPNHLSNLLGEDTKKIKNLALHYPWQNGKWVKPEIEKRIDRLLTICGEVKNLTLVVPDLLDKADHCSNLEFLEYEDVYDKIEWSPYPARPERTISPLLDVVFPKFQEGFNWEKSEFLWERYPYSTITTARSRKDGKLPPWSKPELFYKPVVSFEQKLNFLQRKQAYDRKLNDYRVHVTLTAKGYESLGVNIGLLATMEGLVQMFCQARELDNEISEDMISVYCQIPYGKLGRTRRTWISHKCNLFCFPSEYRHPAHFSKLGLEVVFGPSARYEMSLLED